jgi:hypothetical protein
MKTNWGTQRHWSAVLGMLIGLTGVARAQVGGLPPLPSAPAPAVPGVPAASAVPGAAGTAGAVPAAPAAPQQNLWSFFCLTPDQKASCEATKQKFCQSQFGQLIQNSMLPVGAFTGGLVPQCCPGPGGVNVADLAKPATGAEGAAARIMKEEADAKARRAAVRYLGTVECRRYPEAEVALINALRQDGNECVRWEAAIALSRGCCCTRKTIEALALTVDASTKDGNPPEMSPRVRAAAAAALDHCLACVTDSSTETAPEPRPEPPPPPEPPGRPDLPSPRPLLDSLTLLQTSYALPLTPRPADQPIAEARRALARFKEEQARSPMLLPGKVSVYEALTRARAADLPPLSGLTAVAPSSAPPPAAAPEPSASLLPPTGHRSLTQIFRTSFGSTEP